MDPVVVFVVVVVIVVAVVVVVVAVFLLESVFCPNHSISDRRGWRRP